MASNALSSGAAGRVTDLKGSSLVCPGPVRSKTLCQAELALAPLSTKGSRQSLGTTDRRGFRFQAQVCATRWPASRLALRYSHGRSAWPCLPFSCAGACGFEASICGRCVCMCMCACVCARKRGAVVCVRRKIDTACVRVHGCVSSSGHETCKCDPAQGHRHLRP